jgi:hypothetical protein
VRCECTECGVYMVHAEDLQMGCICPNCQARCTACLGTNSVLSRQQLHQLEDDPFFEKIIEEDGKF